MSWRILKSIFFVASLTFLPVLSGLAQSNNPQAVSMYNLGLTAYKQGSPESAIIFFRRATDIDPNLADAQYNLGIIYQSEKRYKEAIPRFLEVLRIKPNDPDVHCQLGCVYQDAGLFNDAKFHFSSIAPNNPHFSEAQSHIAQINNQLTLGKDNAAISSTTANQAAISSDYLANNIASTNQNNLTPRGSSTSTDLSVANAVTNVSTTYAQPTTPNQVNNGQPVSHSVSTPVPVLANTSLRVIATGFNAPSGLAFDHLGNLYVANFLNDTIDRISTDGSRTQFSSGIHLKGPIGLVADEIGNLYVANYKSGNVARITPAGISAIIATGFHKPYYLALDHEGNLYVSQQEDNSIVRIILPKH